MVELRDWVSDRLHEILGLSDNHVTEYVTDLANKSKSSGDLTKKLKHSGVVDINPKVERFVNELWKKCVREKKKEKISGDERHYSTKTSRNIRSQMTTELESDEEEDRNHSGGGGSDSDDWERLHFLIV